MATTSDSLWIHSLFRASLCLLFITGSLGSSLAPIDCKRENGQTGTRYCKDAFHESYEQNKVKLLTSPKRIGCCLSASLGECIKHAWVAAQCDPNEQKISFLIRDEIHAAQGYINSAAKYLGTHLCGEFKSENCGPALLQHFQVAMHNITTLNGASQIGSSSVFAATVAALFGIFHAQHWH